MNKSSLSYHHDVQLHENGRKYRQREIQRENSWHIFSNSTHSSSLSILHHHLLSSLPLSHFLHFLLSSLPSHSTHLSLSHIFFTFISLHFLHTQLISPLFTSFTLNSSLTFFSLLSPPRQCGVSAGAGRGGGWGEAGTVGRGGEGVYRERMSVWISVWGWVREWVCVGEWEYVDEWECVCVFEQKYVQCGKESVYDCVNMWMYVMWCVCVWIWWKCVNEKGKNGMTDVI